MSFTPYDWNQAIQTRMEYVDERLREGSPVVGLSLPEGLLLVTIHRTQRKLFEVYDRLAFAAIGNQSDIETMRNAAIDFAHREGFQRSPDDVTAQRLVGSVLSPALKRAFGDPFTAPFVFRGLFAEVGETAEADVYYTLGYDGEFRSEGRFSVIAGSPEAENRMLEMLHEGVGQAAERGEALQLALRTWAAGRARGRGPGIARGEEDEEPEPRSEAEILREEIGCGTVEAALLDRVTTRESKFRLLASGELTAVLASFRE